MYELNDTTSAIKEVQKFLYVVSDKLHPEVPRISIDGIYGAETEEAVKIFQALYDIEPTGKVDRITFELLYKAYDENKGVSEEYIIQTEYFPTKAGDQGNHVLHIHLLMLELAQKYPDIGRIPKTTYFSNESISATKELQKIFNYAQNGEIDKELYLRILTELNAIKRLNHT